MASFNGIPKSSVKTNKQDYMNLLYSDSDSDQVPDLKLPPLKGKKQKRKKPSVSVKDDGSCSAVCCFKAFLILLMTSTLIILAGLSIWTLQRVSELQDQVKTMQSSSQADTGLALMQTQMKDMDSSIAELKKSAEILENMKSAIKNIDNRLKRVEATTDRLNKSVSASETLLNTPERLNALSVVVAGLGSDIKKGEKTVTAKTEELEQRLAALEAHQTDNADESQAMKPRMDSQLGDLLSRQVISVNETTTAGIVSVQTELERLTGRLSTLEAFTQSKEPAMDHDEIEHLVLALIQEKLSNETLSYDLDEQAGTVNEMSHKLAQLTAQVNNMEDEEERKKADLSVFREITFTNFQDINASMIAMNAELEAVSQTLSLVNTAIFNISAGTGNTEELPAADQGREPTASEADQGTQPVTEQGGAPAAPPVNQGTGPEAQTTTSGLNKMLTSTPASPEQTPLNIREGEPIPPEATETNDQKLEIEGVLSADDLHKKLMEAWPLRGGELDEGVLLQLLKNSSVTPEELEKFDTNSDGRFSEEELLKSLGLQDTRGR